MESRKNIDNQIVLENCYFVKIVLMILIVLYHSILYWKGNWFIGNPAFSARILGGISDWLNSFHIYGFVLVSGYIFYYIKYERGKYQVFGDFIINKIRRLLVPYVFVSVVWVIPISTYFFNYTLQDIIYDFLLGYSPGQLWFLLMLFWVFVISWIMSNYLQQNNGMCFLLGILSYILGVVIIKVVPNIFMFCRALTFIPIFGIGFKMRQYGGWKLMSISPVTWIFSDIVVFIICRFSSNETGLIWAIVNSAFTFILGIIGAIMIFVVLQNLAEQVQWKKKGFIFLSKYTMGIYLFHQQIIYLFTA